MGAEANFPIAEETGSVWSAAEIVITGANVKIWRLVNASTSLSISGAGVKMNGPVEYGTTVSIGAAGNQIATPTQKVRPYPYDGQTIALWRPGTARPTELGASYHDNSSSCVGFGANRKWTISQPLPVGVYYADCDIQIKGSARKIEASFVSEGGIAVDGAQLEMKSALQEQLLMLAATINLSGAALKTDGGIYSSGAVKISGANSNLLSWIYGGSVTISGAGITIWKP
jgi:hypothetical protein